MPDGAQLLVRSIRDIPVYNGDDEADHGVPKAVAGLKDEIAAADGLLIVTPEYNNSIPGPLKNAIDWLSRPSSDIPRVFRDKPVALMGASPGSFGTLLSQNAWLPVLRTLRADHWSAGRLLVSRAGDVFEEEGRLADDKVAERLRQFMRDFSTYAAARGAAGSQERNG
jgi:NAD(P)H-dependent FMN reductase